MMTTTVLYIVYVLASIAMTVWVARTLHRGGRAFLIESFQGNTELADSVNRLLVVGFYLVNLGFILLWLRSRESVEDPRTFIEALAKQLGVVLLVLGGMHFFNLVVFSAMRSRARLDARELAREQARAASPLRPFGATPPVPPTPATT